MFRKKHLPGAHECPIAVGIGAVGIGIAETCSGPAVVSPSRSSSKKVEIHC